ncbi:MAG TPA: transglutaminase family protein [Rhizomicrobium sp.]|nr:transglutaminase family protein [Rhizomicrobium sp.]
MLIRAAYDIAYECAAETPMLAMLHVRPERRGDLTALERFAVLPHTPYRQYQDGFGNICTRLVMPAGITRFTCDFTVRDDGRPDIIPDGARQVPVDLLPDDVIVFLLGSRYCDTDRLGDLAWSLFRYFDPGWPRVRAIAHYVHQRITFGYQYARADRTAWQAHEERVGVCRDFAHLAVALCRCMNIPARYCTGYLGDIGVPADPAPMDFSAWFDVYLDGAWYTCDARHNQPRIGRILMARGRDATDTAISTAFGTATLKGFKVATEQVDA